MEKYKTFVVFNPRSGNGTTGKKIESLKNLIGQTGSYDFKLTEKANHATELTRQALKSDYNRILAVGGDGTYNEVVNGFYEGETAINPDAVFGVISGGTGADFIKTIEFPKDEAAAIERIKADKIRTLDLGKVTFQLPDKSINSRLFLNIAEIGLGAAVAERVNNTTKVFGSFASFFIGSYLTVMEYKNSKSDIVIDNEIKLSTVTNNIIVGNCRYFGGGMKILPGAEPDDGLLEVLIVGNLTKFDCFRIIPKFYNGSHLNEPKFDFRKARSISVNSQVPVKVEIDGEYVGSTPAEVIILPGAIKVIV